MGSVVETCGYVVNTQFIQRAHACVYLSTQVFFNALIGTKLFIKSLFCSVLTSLNPRVYPQLKMTDLICYTPPFAQYPQSLLLLQRSYLKER